MSYAYSMQTGSTATSPYYDANQGGEDKKKSSGDDYETFIKLLVAQMKNQDPTQPADPTQYISQLASFSSVEQAVQTNKQLEASNAKLEASNAKLEALLVNQTMSQAGHYVGKQLSNADGSVSGIVQSVTIYGDGLLATLSDGQELVIGPGVRISDPANQPAEEAKKTNEGKPA